MAKAKSDPAAISSALKFVSGAVAKKDHIPELLHFKIKDRSILATNGIITACSPIDLDLEVRPLATKFAKAIQTAGDETVGMHLTAAGRLSVRAGRFKAFVECLPDEGHGQYTAPCGGVMGFAGNDVADFVGHLTKLAPFMSEDASRLWAQAICIRSGYMCTTNNIIALEGWHGGQLPDGVKELIVPAVAVNHIIKTKDKLLGVQTDGSSATFWFEGDRWLRTQLVEEQYPDKLNELMNAIDASPVAVNPDIYTAIDTLKPFLEESSRLYLGKTSVYTSNDPDSGATYEIELPQGEGQCFNGKQIRLLEGVAETWDITSKPAAFFGERVRGVMTGFIG